LCIYQYGVKYGGGSIQKEVSCEISLKVEMHGYRNVIKSIFITKIIGLTQRFSRNNIVMESICPYFKTISFILWNKNILKQTENWWNLWLISGYRWVEFEIICLYSKVINWRKGSLITYYLLHSCGVLINII
jgi:hypothetical protein